IQNYDYNAKKFDTGSAWRDFWSYMSGSLGIERQTRGRFAVVTRSGNSLLGAPSTRQSREAADELREQIRALVDSDAEIAPVERDGRWAILSQDGQTVLADYNSESTAKRFIGAMQDLRAEQAAQRTTSWIALLVGFALG